MHAYLRWRFWLIAGFILLPHASCWAAAIDSSATTGPLGPPGEAHYRIARDGVLPGSVVESFVWRRGPVEQQTNQVVQWLQLDATKANGTKFSVWLLCKVEPPESLTTAEEAVRRFILQEGNEQPIEFQDQATGRALLPMLGDWPHLLPRPAEGSALHNGFPDIVKLLGLRFAQQQTAAAPGAVSPPPTGILKLRSDALIGVPSNARQVDDRRRYDGSDYQLVRLTEADYDTMIEAGMNCFNVDAEQRRWLEHRPVYYWGGGMAGLPYPELLYRANYLGPALFLDEPAVVTRDYVIRPRLQQEPEFGHQLTPQIMLDAFREHFHKAKYEGAPTELVRALSSRTDVDLGDMRFLQANLFTWETMISTGVHQLTEGSSPPPAAIVFEPPGHVGTRRTLPEMNMVYGCQIPVDNPANLADLLNGFLRGAARLSSRSWGISIYGAVDPSDSPWLLTHAYDSGARLFFFWDNGALACVPFGECLALSRHLSAHISRVAPRDLSKLAQAAEALLLLPPGYNLGHVQMGKGSLWGLGELNLERTNRFGVTYRRVMGNLFGEIERCLRLGIVFDVAWDLPGLKPTQYREIVHVREDGTLQTRNEAGEETSSNPRPAQRPDGHPPQLTLEVAASDSSGSKQFTARAEVTEGSAPVFYTPRSNREGVYENAVVFWELFGPRDEDYRVLLGENNRLQISDDHPTYHVAIKFQVQRPGTYRLRAAIADLSGRTSVVWKTLGAEE
jgi:hypothetical protein